jgi:hypothetical protein
VYSRVTQLEIDTLRIDIADAVELFRTEVLPQLREHDGYEGAVVLTIPDGKGILITLWDTPEAADGAVGFASAQLERNMTLFRSPPGREHYEVSFLELPGVAVG